ncbi:hypothetical protein HZB60_09750 [candidate division KSB1 bacterium]|nr:hypothetical protein [candidate division KSB1 bacterium]
MNRVLVFVLLGIGLAGAGFAALDTRADLPAAWRDALTARYGSLAASPLSTGVFYDLVLPLSGIERLHGAATADEVDLPRFRQVAFELERAALVAWPHPGQAELRELGRLAARDEVYPLAIIDYRVNRIRAGLDKARALTLDPAGVPSVDPAAVIEAAVFVAAPLYDRTFRGSSVRFQVDLRALYFSNRAPRPDFADVDLGDGAGWQRVNGARELVANYRSTGPKTLRVRVIGEDGSPRISRSRFDVRTLDAPPPTATWSLTAHEAFNGEFATGDAYVYLADGHTDVTRPAIVTDGFDIDNTMFWNEIYDLLNQQQLAETIHALGYDLIVLNYTNAQTYLQANAYVTETLLDTLEQIIAPTQQYCIVGPSMGGLTTRYALVHREFLGDPFHVRTWFSFDSPHTGANIPLGLQHWVNFFAGQSAEAQALLDALNSPSAEQMLVFHHAATSGTTPGANPLHAAFLSDIAALGNFPTQPRIVALANGSGSMISQGFNPGAQIVRYEFSTFPWNIRGNVWALNNAATQRVFQGVMTFFFVPVVPSQDVNIAATLPWDNAPGGWRNTMADMDSVVVPYGDLIALYPHHCFIPTISALALNTTDPFFDIAGAGNLYALTPFDSLYFPAVNEDHVEVNANNLYWIINELVDSLPPPAVTAFSAGATLDLHWSKVPAARSYQVFTTLDPEVWPNAPVTVADTLWSEPLPVDGRKFYRVVASLNP